MNRESFLERVRAAAQQGIAYRVSTQSLPDDVGYVGAAGDCCAAFAAEAQAAGGEVYLVDDLAAAGQEVMRLCREAGAQRALCWQHPLLDRLELDTLLLAAGVQRIDADSLALLSTSQRRELLLSAQVGITSCEWAVAETGSLFLWARPGRERTASLLPPLHIAVIERGQILPDLYDALAKLQALGSEQLPSNAVFVTGPSKTGDMELELTTGVHGPGRWCVVVVRSSGVPNNITSAR